ncbi:MAG: outer membrane protein assembly factor BamA [Desulfohalobiaceae bacterium]|nr:outer membrane protein assembly factor BamA [Desulfohalobiaceae bacterium]
MSKPRSRTRRALPFVLLLALLFCSVATEGAAAKSRIMILPFQVNAREQLDYLRRNVPVLLRKALQKQGHEVYSLSRARELLKGEETEAPDLETVNKLMRDADVTHAVYGSLTMAGEWISLDAKLVGARYPRIVQTPSVSQEGLNRLQPAARELGRKISRAISAEKKVAVIEVTGNKRLDDEAVLQRIETSEGEAYDPEQIDRDIKKLYESGYFQNISVRVENQPGGKKIIYEVEERPQISEVVIKGADSMDKEDILETINSQSGDIINPESIARDLEAVRELYRKKGYYHVRVDYSQKRADSGQVKLLIEIKEGEKRYIQSIRIKGAEKIDPQKLKDQLALSERGFFSWLTGRGVLKERLLNRDAAALEAYYANHGFVEAKVGQPQIKSMDQGLRITFQVREGPRYTLGEVSLQGDLIVSPENLLQRIQVDDMADQGAYFDQSALREDLRELEDFYRKQGYAFANAKPQLDKNSQEQTIDVTYIINKEHKVFINRIQITGNTKTRDNVIRRELDLAGGDLFNSEKIASSKQNLQKLDYFKSVDLETLPSREKDQMDLKVKVREKRTGSFSLGAGYSTVRQLFFTGKIQERNFLGRGYDLSFKGSFSSKQTLYQASFWNPHLYDGPLGLGFEAYNSDREYSDYDLKKTGGKSKFAYSIGDHTRLYWNYSLEEYRVENIDSSASEQIKDLKGENWSSAVNISAVRDTTNRRLYPTQGSKNTLSLKYSGGPLGGDDNFIKPSYEFSSYHPLLADFVFSWHWEYAHLFENTSDTVPDFERFYLGGIHTVRGYDYQDIHCTDKNGDDIGGYKKFYTNAEISYPLVKNMGVRILAFFDAGNVWNKDEHIDGRLYKSVGAGLRWNSPMGPLRLEYGYPLDDLDGQNGQFEFTVGGAF